MTSTFTPAEVPSGRITLNEREYMEDARGALVPIEMIKPQNLLEDETVRKVAGFWLALSEQVTRFKGHAFVDLANFDAILEQQYKLTKGGKKGNRTYQTHDGLIQIQVRINDQIDFGPELQVAKNLFDECLNEWASDTRPELRMLVTRAFSTDKEGTINRAALFSLLRTESQDERWNSAVAAGWDALRVVGSKTYLRMMMRSSQTEAWQTVTIDLAKA